MTRQTEEYREKLLYPPTGKIHLIIDSDTKNEVDDQFAIAWALRSTERFQVDAVYAAPFSHDCFRQFNKAKENLAKAVGTIGHASGPVDGMKQSYREILKLFSLLGESAEGRVFRGSDRYMAEDGSPVDSEAAWDLIRRAHESGEPLYIAAIGTATNIASAIRMDPTIINNIVVVWLGGNSLGFHQGIEFNLIQDVRAAQTLFDSGVPLIWVPCLNVASLLSVSEPELREYLLGKSPIATYLAQIVLDAFRDSNSDIAFMGLNRTSNLLGNCDEKEAYLSQFPSRYVAWSRIIWDIATIAILKNPNWVPSTQIPAPILRDDFTWAPTDPTRHRIRMATYCYRNMIFGDLFRALGEKRT